MWRAVRNFLVMSVKKLSRWYWSVATSDLWLAICWISRGSVFINQCGYFPTLIHDLYFSHGHISLSYELLQPSLGEIP